MMPDGSCCPNELKDSLDAYSRTGRQTGDFLRACLENDLLGAVARADLINTGMIPQVVAYIHWEMPPMSSGNPERVRDWIKRGGLRGTSDEKDKS